MRAVLLLALLSSAFAGPFGGGAPFGGGSAPGPATPTVAGIAKLRPITIGPFLAGVALTLTSLPAPTTELAGATTRRAWADTANVTQVALVWQGMGTAPSAGTHGGVQCSTDQSTWVFAEGSADGDLGTKQPQVTLALNTLVVSAWSPLATACRGERYWRVVTDDGSGAVSPVVGTIYMLAQ